MFWAPKSGITQCPYKTKEGKEREEKRREGKEKVSVKSWEELGQKRYGSSGELSLPNIFSLEKGLQ